MIVVRTPLRISFNGGGTDFKGFYNRYGGAVLSATINKSVYIAIRERFDDMIYLNWSKKEIVDKVDDIEHELIRESMKMTGVTRGVEITTLSDVPSTGSGLGSSSSITVGLLHALYAYRNELVSAERLADEACRIEIDILGKPIGKQDQYAAAFGGFNLISFSSTGTKVVPINLSRHDRVVLSEHMMLFHTGITRNSNEVLSKQKDAAVSEQNLDLLKDKAKLAYDTQEALEIGDMGRFSNLLGSGWKMKHQINPDTTSKEIDALYNKAIEAGATSGKIVGAGGGGFLLVFSPLDRKKDVRESLCLRELPFEFTEYGSKMIFDYREV